MIGNLKGNPQDALFVLERIEIIVYSRAIARKAPFGLFYNKLVTVCWKKEIIFPMRIQAADNLSNQIAFIDIVLAGWP